MWRQAAWRITRSRFQEIEQRPAGLDQIGSAVNNGRSGMMAPSFSHRRPYSSALQRRRPSLLNLMHEMMQR
jgi:hypothetical protein